MTTMLPNLVGASNIYGAGMLELGMSFSMEQLVIDNDIIGMSRYAKRGIDVRKSTLAYDVIREVGIGNDFLGNADTMRNIDLPSRPRTFDRNMYETWVKAGSMDPVDIAHEIVTDILANHRPEPISNYARKEIDKIIAEADRRKKP
jgi:trimethylamine--corrinoid protein Co-methyltransferase